MIRTPEKDAEKAAEIFFLVSKKFSDKSIEYLISLGRTKEEAEYEVQNMKFTISVESFIGTVAIAIWKEYYFK